MKLRLGYRTLLYNETRLKGHEFHYSRLVEQQNPLPSCVNAYTAKGVKRILRFYHYKNVWAGYTHLYWADPVGNEWFTKLSSMAIFEVCIQINKKDENIYAWRDKGRTGIHGGERVDKDDIRIEANGTLDEVNAEIGIIRALLPAEHEWQSLLGKIQMEMMAVMSHVATPSAIRDKNPNKISDDLVLVCEEQIDALSAKMEDNGYFILPGGSLVSAHLQLARTIVRRAERRLWTLNRKDPVSPGIMQFVNRLSDLFFTMARYEMFRQGNAEERWQSFLYKRKK